MKTFNLNLLHGCTANAASVGSLSGQSRRKHGNDTATTRSRHGNGCFRFRALFLLLLFLTLGVGQMWANGGIGYKGVKFTKNGSATGWYNIHNVSWDYSDASYECRSGQSGVTDFNNASLGTVTTLKLKAFVVIGWTDNSDYVAGQLKYRLYKQSESAPSYSTYNVGNYGSSSNSSSAANVLVSSDNNRVVGNASLTTDIVTSSTPAGNYYLQLQGLGRMQWSNGSSHGDFNANNGSEVKATLLVPGFTTTSTSNDYGSVAVGSNSSTTISFTQHYGTTLTTSDCSLTNSTDFEVTAISETGVTVKYKPQTAGDKSCTLTITDANSKTCTIDLTGTTPAGLTVVAGTGISAVTGSDNDISAGDEIAITATVATGYTWSTWTKTGSGTLSTFTATTKNQTVVVGTAANMTLTASATEIIRTVNITGGTAASTTAGVSTTGTATVSLPEGKKFTGWTLGDGVTLVTGTTASKTITFHASQNSTVTATFADRAGVKMYFAKPTTLGWSKVYAHTWKAAGGVPVNKAYPGVELETTEVINNIVYYVYQYYTEADGIGGAATGNAGWDRVIFGDNDDARKTGDLTIADGHYYYTNSTTTGSTSATAHAWYIKGTMTYPTWNEDNPFEHDRSTNTGEVTINLEKGTTYEFKVYDQLGALMWSNSTALGGITNSVDATTLYKDDESVMKITPDKTGAYKFTITNTNTTAPKIAVQYPSQYLVGSWDSWDEDDHPFDANGYANVTLAAGSYKFQVKYNGTWYGAEGAGTITSTVKDWSSYASSGSTYDVNITITTAGKYVFGWNGKDKKISVIYPADTTKAQLATGKYVYFDARNLTAAGWWKDKFSTRFWLKNYASGVDITHVDCNIADTIENKVFYALIPTTGQVGQIQLNRMKPDFTEGPWSTANKVYAIDRTSTAPNCLKEETGKEAWFDGWTPQWTTYCPPMSESTLEDNGTKTYGGTGESSTPYLIAAGDEIKLIASSTSALNDANMTAYYQFKNGASEIRAGSSTATYDHTSSETNNTVYTITAEAYNYYNSTSGTHLASRAIYYQTRTPYTVTHTLNGMTTASGATGTNAAVNGVAYTATFTAETGYSLPSTISVTVGGAAKTQGTHFTWSVSAGVGTLTVLAANVTGNIVATINGVPQTLTFAPASGTAWNNSANWSPACVPTIEHDVVIAKPVEVNINNARAKSVVIDQYDGNTGKLDIPAGKELVIAGTLTKKNAKGETAPTGEKDIIIHSTEESGLGALVIKTYTGNDSATVYFYSKSYNVEADRSQSVSQYVGTPFGNRPKMLYQFYNSWMYKFAYPNSAGNPYWDRIDGDTELEAFSAYSVCSADGTKDAGHTYQMSGALVTSDDQEFNDMSCNATGVEGNTYASNEHMFANSWMAPIKISAFQASDFGYHTTATIYIFNSGSPEDYDNGETLAGQYSTYPIGTAGDAVIPAMQAFSVYTYGSTGDAASLTLDYSRLVYDPAIEGTTPTPNKAPRRGKVQLDETEKMHVYVSAKSGYRDMVYMLAHEDFSENFENGWDGSKMFGESVAPQLYAATPDGKMAVNCVPTWEGTLIGFRKGENESIYTFSFDYAGEGEWYLNDLLEQTSTFISPEDTYTFTASGNDEARFIISHTPIHYVPTGVGSNEADASTVRKIILNEHVYIIRNGRMYDATGVMVR